MIANIDGFFATINVFDLLPILRLANIAADKATDIDKQAWGQVWHDLKDATGWDDKELAENILNSKIEAQSCSSSE